MRNYNITITQFCQLYISINFPAKIWIETLSFALETLYLYSFRKNIRHAAIVVMPWCIGYHYCTTSSINIWIQVLRRSIPCSRCVKDWQRSWPEVRLNVFCQSAIPQKWFIVIIIMIIIIIAIIPNVKNIEIYMYKT